MNKPIDFLDEEDNVSLDELVNADSITEFLKTYSAVTSPIFLLPEDNVELNTVSEASVSKKTSYKRINKVSKQSSSKKGNIKTIKIVGNKNGVTVLYRNEFVKQETEYLKSCTIINLLLSLHEHGLIKLTTDKYCKETWTALKSL
jgi:hypothetical protein